MDRLQFCQALETLETPSSPCRQYGSLWPLACWLVVGTWQVLLAQAAKATLYAVGYTGGCRYGYRSVSKLGSDFVKERPDRHRHRHRLALRPQRHRLRQRLVMLQIWILADESALPVSTE